MTCPAAPVQLVAVANDITFSSGSFGTKEDAVFRAATEYALEEKLPIIYLAANAGARVGLAQEIKQCLQVPLSLMPLLHAYLACSNRISYLQCKLDTCPARDGRTWIFGIGKASMLVASKRRP